MPAVARGRTKCDPKQLDLFSLAVPRISNETADPIRLNGRETLAKIPAEDGRGIGSERRTRFNALGSRGEDGRGDGPASATVSAAGPQSAPVARPGLGDGPGEIHLPSTRDVAKNEEEHAEAGNSNWPSALAEPEPVRNRNNYRITESDRLGSGSLRQKCRDNLAAIRLLKQIEAEERTATQEEKRVLVRYVGWGGLPQVFDSYNAQWERVCGLSTGDLDFFL